MRTIRRSGSERVGGCGAKPSEALPPGRLATEAGCFTVPGRFAAEVTVDPAVLAACKGVYQMNPKFALAVRAEADRLSGTGQPKFQ